MTACAAAYRATVLETTKKTAESNKILQTKPYMY